MRLHAALLVVVGCARSPTPPPEKKASHAPPAAPAAVAVRFLERDARDRPWRPITDQARLDRLASQIDNEPARFARALYAEAWTIAPPGELDEPTLFIGIEEGGNHAEVGLEIDDGGKRTRWPELPYLRLADDADSLRDTLLHETGHALHALLARGGSQTGDQAVAPIPHSTAAVTDRRTAFNEGLAIHLETVNAHCGRDPATRAFYDHHPLSHRVSTDSKTEFFFPLRDVMTYAQTFARYQMVRDDLYAFETAARGDYLRVQLDPARDLRSLRDPGSLVASEGFVASVVFQHIAAGGCPDGLMALVPRYAGLWRALRATETTSGPLDPVPLLDLVAGAPEMIDVFLDLSHGVTVDPEAAARWAELYDAALAVDVARRKQIIAALELRRARWREEARDDPAVLARRIGPVVPVVVAGLKVRLVAFGDPVPVSFDVNAAGAPMLALVPGWSAAQVAEIIAERDAAPFASLDDLRKRLARRRIATGALGASTP